MFCFQRYDVLEWKDRHNFKSTSSKCTDFKKYMPLRIKYMHMYPTDKSKYEYCKDSS